MSARAQAVFRRTYSRPKEDGTHETFEETLDRVIGHQRWLWERAQRSELAEAQEDELNSLRRLMLSRRVLPSGRTLWLGGTEVARKRELSQFACSGSIVKTVYDVVDNAWLLLNGCGIGVKPEMGVLNGFARPIRDVRVMRSERTIEDGPSGEDSNTETWDNETRTWTIRVGDSGEAWAKAVGKLIAGKYPAETLVLDFRAIRAEGSLLSRYGWRSSGDTVIAKEMVSIAALLSRRAGQLLSRLDIADLVNHLGVIQTGRRGAEILLMDEGDPEISDFIRFKEGCWADSTKHQRQQSNNSIVFWSRPTRERLEHIFAAIVGSGGNEPGFVNGEAARKRAPWFDTVNPCLTGDTLIPTGSGLIRIADLDGRTIAVRDGNGNMVEAKFEKTAEMAELLSVELSDGSIYRVTPSHRFVNVDGDFVEAKDLEPGQALKTADIKGLFGKVHSPREAYRDAWLIADGTWYNSHKNSMLVLYSPKQRHLEELLENGFEFGGSDKRGCMTARFLGVPYADKSKVPNYVLQGDQETVQAYLRGAVQSDGHIGHTDKGWMVQFSSKHRNYLQDLQALLRLNGVRARIALDHTAGYASLPDGKGGEKMYFCQTVWSLTVSNPAKFFEFYDSSLNKRGPYKVKETVVVTSVETIPELEDVYCCGVPTTTSFDLPTVHSGNCVEILLGDKSFCNLIEVDVSKFMDLAELCEALRIAGRANYRQTCVDLDDGVLQRSWHELNSYLHLCGTSITGVARRPDLIAHDYRTMRTAATLGAWSMADELGMPRPKNVTCVKPSGTVSKVMDTTEGAHKPLGRYIFNSIVYARTDPLVTALREAGYEVRPHPTADTQVLVKFPVESTGVLFEDFHGTPVNLEPAVDQLERYRLLMDNYVDQNCSLTVSYDPSEVPEIIDWLMAHWDSYVGVSWAFRTDPTKTAADFGAAYLPQQVVDRAAFETYTAQLRPLETEEKNLGGAVDLDELEDDCKSGFCPIR